MLTQHEFFRPEEGEQWDVVRGLLGKKRKDILKWLGWPGEKWCVHLISKIDMNWTNVEDLLQLWAACHEGTILPRLRHLPVINAEIIRITTDPELLPMVTDSFLRQVGKEQDKFIFSTSRLLRYVNNMASSLNCDCPVFLNVQQAFVYILEDDMEAFSSVLCDSYGAVQLPQPDFPITSGRQPSRFELEPVRSAFDLYEWAKLQKNCAFWKIDEILAGGMLIFKVRRPLRGTLSLVPESQGAWRLDEFKAAENRPVPRDVYFEMAAHLDRCIERRLEMTDDENEPKQYAV